MAPKKKATTTLKKTPAPKKQKIVEETVDEIEEYNPSLIKFPSHLNNSVRFPLATFAPKKGKKKYEILEEEAGILEFLNTTFSQTYNTKLQPNFIPPPPIEQKTNININDFPSLKFKTPQKYLPQCKKSPPFVFKERSSNKKKETFIHKDKIIEVSLFQTFTTDKANKFIINTGGPIQSLDWLPVTQSSQETSSSSQSNKTTKTTQRKSLFPSSANNNNNNNNSQLKQYLAVSSLNSFTDKHVIGKPIKYKQLLQIWDMGIQTKSWNIQTSLSDPYLAIGICHSYGSAVDVRWCKNSSFFKNSINQMGVLSVCFTDGKLRLFSIPSYEYLQTLRDKIPNFHSQFDSQEFEKTMFISIKPFFVASINNTCVWTSRWQFDQNSNSLLCGTTDGRVALWRFSGDEIETNRKKFPPLFCVLCHPTEIRGLSWCPRDSNSFATVGRSGSLYVWDIRDPLSPVFEHKLNGFALNLDWVGFIPAIYIASDDGVVKYFDENEFSVKNISTHFQAVWDANGDSNLDMVGTCGDDGSVAVAFLEKIYYTKRNNPPVCTILDSTIGKTEDSRDVICFDDEYKMSYIKPTDMKLNTTFPDPLLSMKCFRWSPNRSNCGWAAFGGNSGLLFCQPVGGSRGFL